MRVFVSHSAKDQVLFMDLTSLLVELGLEVLVAEWYFSPGMPLDKKVFAQIDKADCMVALLTENGVASSWVQQEIGYMLKSGKPLVPLVEKGTDPRELGALQGREYIEYDPLQARQAIIRVSTYLKSLELGEGVMVCWGL